MRTKSEKRLLLALILIVLAGGNYYGYKWVSQKKASLVLTEKELRADQAEDAVVLKQQDDWSRRKDWIDKNEPDLKGEDGNAKTAEIQEYVRKGAISEHLEIINQNLGRAQATPGGTRVSITVKVKGPMKGICHWLASMQKPENFYAVSAFSLNADADEKSMDCEIEMVRYFKGGS